jgi:outer membrane murein-binding lipoprotein Lpp
VDPQGYAVVAIAVVVVGLALAWALLAGAARKRRAELARALAEAHDDVQTLAARLEALTTEVEQTRQAVEQQATPAAHVEPYVITGRVLDEPGNGPDVAHIVSAIEASRPVWVPAKPLRESLVHVVALGHGVRRALSPEVRDRIVLEMKAEVRRSRRLRKAEIRAVRRYLRHQRNQRNRAA